MIETQNIATVEAFMRLFADPASTAELIASRMTEDCMVFVRGTGKPPTYGRAAVQELFGSWLKDGVRYQTKTLETFARGPLVVNVRSDVIVRPDKREQPSAWFGVFLLKDGRIKDWDEIPNTLT